MEVIFMDTTFKMTRIVDAFSSLIWNDYYFGAGDFELRLPMDTNTLLGIRQGWYASIKESRKYMVVEKIEITTSIDQGNYAIIGGRSLESILDRRVLKSDMVFAGSLVSAVTRILSETFISPDDSKRKLSILSSSGTLDQDILDMNVNLELNAGELVYNVIYDMCYEQKVGFEILPEEGGGMVFRLYKGLDRSYAQEKNPWVVFSPKFENIDETDMVSTTEDLRNVIIVSSKWTERVAAGEDKDGSTIYEEVQHEIQTEIGDATGLERRELFATSSVRPDPVDKESFGSASSRVSTRQFSTWEAVYFDSKGYDEAYKEWQKKLEAAFSPRVKETTKQVWVEYQPGDPGYLEEGVSISVGDPARVNGYWTTETVPGETYDQWAARNTKYLRLSDMVPNKDDYMVYAWVLTDFNGYNAALAEAQAQIDAEYAAAVQDAENRAKEAMQQAGAITLAPYLKTSEFEGTVDPKVQAQFGVDYYLGDVVQIVNAFDFQAVTRVIGMMYAEEEGVGVTATPTFQSDDKAVFDI